MSRLVLYEMSDVKFTNHLERIYPIVLQLEDLIIESVEALDKDMIASVVPRLAIFAQGLAEFRKKERAETFESTAKGEAHISDTFEYVRLILFTDGLTYHLWRLMYHLSEEED